MSLSFKFCPFISSPKSNRRFTLLKPRLQSRTFSSASKFCYLPKIVCAQGSSDQLPVSATKPRWENWLSTAASLYPVYVTVGGVVACLRPSTFAWFVNRGPISYGLSLGFIMLAMGLTLELKDFLSLFMRRPFSILYGCLAQYTIMPTLGMVISKLLGLPPSLSAGLILLACCPGGTASNVVTLIAQGDVPLSIVMTVCTTLGAVILTPLLTKTLAGAYVPVDALKLSLSTLQVVVVPILLGSYLQSTFPTAVKAVIPFAPLFAVLTSSLLACRSLSFSFNLLRRSHIPTLSVSSLSLIFFLGSFSSVFSENVIGLKSSVLAASFTSDLSPLLRIQSILSGELGVVILSVLVLHFAGFFVGYITAALGGFSEPQRRAISVEVGMQNSSLGVVLATTHFTSPMVSLPPAMSAVIMNIMGSTLAFFWKYMDASDSKMNPETDEKRG